MQGFTAIIGGNGEKNVQKLTEKQQQRETLRKERLQNMGSHELTRLAIEGDKEANEIFWNRADKNGTARHAIEVMTGTPASNLSVRETNPLSLTAYKRRFKEMQNELGYETASPLERLLIERIVWCWYHLQNAEAYYLKQMSGSSLAVAGYAQQSLDRAQKRYIHAVQSLAVVRRLQIPVVQVNIGEKQVNVIQGAGRTVPEISAKEGGEEPENHLISI